VSSADRLLKALHIALAEKMPYAALRRIDWFDFRDHDHPDTEAPVEMACEAFLYLSLDGHGNWDGVHEVLIAVIDAMGQETSQTPSPGSLHRLKAILEECPVDADSVRDRFRSAYGHRV
jgi:hypothetical protein